MSKVILVTGATGKQGGALISALLDAPDAQSYRLIALTRKPTSASAKKLADQGVDLIQGDLNDVPRVFQTAQEIAGGRIWGVFAVLVSDAINPFEPCLTVARVAHGAGASAATEEAQGKALVDESIANGVEYFVYSSVERGGDEKSWENPTPIPHFVSKHRIELHLREAAEDQMMWTILRPTAFMENWGNHFFGRMIASTWKIKNPDNKMQLIACRDIGLVAALCFGSPAVYNHRAIGLAGSDITYAEANEVFAEKTGMPEMPEAYHFLSRTLLWMLPDMDKMFGWMATDGYRADIPGLKELHPGLMSWGDWLEKESGWVSKG